MTEFDTMEYVDEDRNLLTTWIPRAKGPEDIYKLLAQAIYERLATLDYGRCEKIVRLCLEQPPKAGTLSMRVANVCVAVLDRIKPKLQPEDMRTAMLWLVGDPKSGAGIIQSVLDQIPDAETAASMSRVESKVVAVRRDLDDRDSQVFDREVRRLPSGLQDLIRGRLYDAAWHWKEEDGESYRHEAITARSMARRFLRERHEVFA